MACVTSIDLRVALAPEATYRTLVERPAPTSWRCVCSRPLLTLIVLAVCLPLSATHTVTLKLITLTAVGWSFVLVVQFGLAMFTVGAARGRSVSLTRALELWFLGHVPYTAWLLVVPVLSVTGAWMQPLLGLTFVVPVVWSTLVETAYCRAVLHSTPADARRRVALHQALMLAIVVAMVLWAVGGPNNLVAFGSRMAVRLRG